MTFEQYFFNIRKQKDPLLKKTNMVGLWLTPGTDQISHVFPRGVIFQVKILLHTFDPSTKIVMFCFCPVLPERPDGENYRNVSRAQLHRRWTDITGWQMLQCLQRYVFPLTALFSVAWITLWTCTQQSPATASSKHIQPSGKPIQAASLQ